MEPKSSELFSPGDRKAADALARLALANPFLPERGALEKQALGSAARPTPEVLSATGEIASISPNVPLLSRRAEELVEKGRKRLVTGVRIRPPDLELYDGLVLYRLYDAFHSELLELALAEVRMPAKIGAGLRAPSFRRFAAEADRLRTVPGLRPWSLDETAHLFACYFQIRRAFQFIFHAIVGRSRPASRLRAAVWQSIFTADARRFQRWFFRRSADVTTLIAGSSGTGKELVARAIGWSRYVPFDPAKECFTEGFASSFHGLNLSALSPALVESELFGHRRGAFTGAVDDRAGWLEVCRPLGTVFLDEIGELDSAIQVKLLRVLQGRTFQRIGETASHRFEGKIVAATNRDLEVELGSGRFREDFYYRLCSDLITTPRLAEQLADCPDDLRVFVRFILRWIIGGADSDRFSQPEMDEADSLVEEVVRAIGRSPGVGYDWPGNVRELEQCVRNILIRGEYRPARIRRGNSPRERFAFDAAAGSLTADDLLRRYVTLVYARSKSLQEAARDLDLDRRTLRAKIDPKLLEELRKEKSGAFRGQERS